MAAFSAPTPKDGLTGPLLFDPKVTRRVDRTLSFGPEVRGTIPVVRDIPDSEALVLAGQQAGALAIILIDATDILHEDIVTTIWGTPTMESAARMPRIPYICITKSDGERLAGLARVKDLATLPRDGDAFGFLETEMIRGRNEVEARLRAVTEEIEERLRP